MNIHFKSKDVGKLMLERGTSGMLYFLYSRDMVAVLVCHDIAEGEFVLQVPYFPPIEKLSDYKDNIARCLDIVRKSIFSESMRNTQTGF